MPDDSLFEVLDDVDDFDLLVYLYDYQKLLLNNISLQRFSQDSSPVNNYGYKLLGRNTATLIIGTKTLIRRKIKPDNKPWYKTSYYEKRKQFNINRKKYNLNKSSENKQLYLQNVVVNTRKR